MKKLIFGFCVFLSLSTSFAHDDGISEKVVQVRRGMGELNGFVTVLCDAVERLTKRSEQLERDLIQSQSRTLQPPVPLSAFDERKIKRVKFKAKSDEFEVPLYLEHDFYGYYAQDKDLVESNRNYLERLRALSQENEQLKRDRVGVQVVPTVSYGGYQPFPVATGFGQPSVRESRYRVGGFTSWGKEERVVHLYSSQTVPYYAEEKHILESNENYYRRLEPLERENLSLQNDKQRLEGEQLGLRAELERLQSQIREKEESLENSLRSSREGYEQKIQSLSSQLSLSVSRDSLEKAKQDHANCGILKGSLEKERDQLRSQNGILVNERDQLQQVKIRSQQEIERLNQKIVQGEGLVSTLMRQQEKQSAENRELKEQVAQVNGRWEEKLQHGMKALEGVTKERNKAVLDFQTYKEVVKSVLSTDAALLRQIETMFSSL